jgi:hypothetical protein
VNGHNQPTADQERVVFVFSIISEMLIRFGLLIFSIIATFYSSKELNIETSLWSRFTHASRVSCPITIAVREHIIESIAVAVSFLQMKKKWILNFNLYLFHLF